MRIGQYLMSAAVVAGLTACSGSQAAPGTSEREPQVTAEAPPPCLANDDAGTVSIWHSMGSNVALDLWEEFKAEFDRTHESTLDLRHFGGDLSLVEALAAASPNDLPDVVIATEQATRTLLDSGLFMQPDECDPALAAAVLPLARATYTVQGNLVALPFGVSVPVLIYDMAEFREAGLDPVAPPLTLDALLDASAAIQQSGASPYGWVLPDSCGNLVLEQYSARRGSLVSTPRNGREGGLTVVDFATAESIADLTEIRDGVVAGHVKYIGANSSNFDDLEAIVAPGDGAAMTVHTSAALGDILELLESGNWPGVELGVGPLPGPGVGSLLGGNALWMLDSGDSERVGRTLSALKWLYEPQQLARLAAATGYVPATGAAATEQVLLDRWAQYPQLKVAYDQVVSTPVSDATAGLVMGPSNDRAFVLYDACTKIMADGEDVKATLQDASRLMNDLLVQYDALQSGAPLPNQPQVSGPSSSAGTALPPGDVEVSGFVECASGEPVVGVWVESASAGSGWAERSEPGASRVEYRYTLPVAGRYQLHVGCGGGESDWGSTNFSPFVDGPLNSFICRDTAGAQDGVCAIVSV